MPSNHSRKPRRSSPEPKTDRPENGPHVELTLLKQSHASGAPLARPRIAPAAIEVLRQRGYSDEDIFALVIPRRTLMRRRADNEPLTVEETDKAIRLERIATQAERVFGDPAKAHCWLRKPKRELSGATPLDWLASESAARVVEEMLHRIEHGIFA